eukprot:4003847-Alexandrium_andersonii.AAC.1
MSASLVGSEMCIRDRRSAAPGRAATPQAPRGAYRAARRRHREPARPSACLLYTSDAADDM